MARYRLDAKAQQPIIERQSGAGLKQDRQYGCEVEPVQPGLEAQLRAHRPLHKGRVKAGMKPDQRCCARELEKAHQRQRRRFPRALFTGTNAMHQNVVAGTRLGLAKHGVETIGQIHAQAGEGDCANREQMPAGRIEAAGFSIGNDAAQLMQRRLHGGGRERAPSLPPQPQRLWQADTSAKPARSKGWQHHSAKSSRSRVCSLRPWRSASLRMRRSSSFRLASSI